MAALQRLRIFGAITSQILSLSYGETKFFWYDDKVYRLLEISYSPSAGRVTRMAERRFSLYHSARDRSGSAAASRQACYERLHPA